VHPSERLAALLAGELSTDERRALEAELARDPDLRAQLEAMERADAALTAEPRTELPEGAEDRLLAALAPTLDAELGASEVARGAEGSDELAARRATRGRRRTWLTAAGGVAAAVAAVAVVLPNLTGSGDDSADTTDVAMEAGEEAGEDAASMDADDAGAALPDGPTVLGGDRELDAEGADALLAAPELEAIAGSALAPEDAAGLGADWAVRLGAPLAGAASDSLSTFDADVETESVDDGEAQEEEAPAEGGAESADRATAGVGVLVGPDVGDDDLADVGRCLETLLATGDVAIPVTAELVVFDGEPAIAFGLVSQDADGQVQRREVWVLDRATCEVRYFTQA
jgi:hypothetical protein